MSHILHKNNFPTGLPVAKTLIKYNNNLKEMEENEKEPIDIELTEQKAGPEMMKLLLTLNNQMYKKKTRKILLWLTSLRLTKANRLGKFSKKQPNDCLMIVVSYLVKRKIMKIFMK